MNTKIPGVPYMSVCHNEKPNQGLKLNPLIYDRRNVTSILTVIEGGCLHPHGHPKI